MNYRCPVHGDLNSYLDVIKLKRGTNTGVYCWVCALDALIAAGWLRRIDKA